MTTWPQVAEDGALLWPAPNPQDPFYCHGPTLVSFSGGRTSAYMLWRVLCAHAGVLPDYVVVAFANTGKEAPETLRFVYECGVRWNVRIFWVEWRAPASAEMAERFAVVSFDSASRNGEPLRALFRSRRYLPNAVTRFCTMEAKIRVMKYLMLTLGFEHWNNMIGLRADERRRLVKVVLNNLAAAERWRSTAPLALAGVMKRHIHRHWLGRNAHGRDRRYVLPQGFDLGLRDDEGNCDECMLKGFMVLAAHERAKPGTLDWWIEAEAEVTAMIAEGKSKDIPSGARFITEHSYAEIKAYAHSTAVLPDLLDVEVEGECGVACAVDDAAEEVDDGAFGWLVDQLRKAAETPLRLPSAPVKREPAIGDLFEMAA